MTGKTEIGEFNFLLTKEIQKSISRAILLFANITLAIIARLTRQLLKIRRAMIADLNKIWHMLACARAMIARMFMEGCISLL